MRVLDMYAEDDDVPVAALQQFQTPSVEPMPFYDLLPVTQANTSAGIVGSNEAAESSSRGEKK